MLAQSFKMYWVNFSKSGDERRTGSTPSMFCCMFVSLLAYVLSVLWCSELFAERRANRRRRLARGDA